MTAIRALLLSAMLACAGGCATMDANGMPADDPLEDINRSVYAFNDWLDLHILEPLIKLWRLLIPEPLRKGLYNAVVNLGAPISVVNAILQWNVEGTLIELERFLINSTLGIGGLFDVASRAGIDAQREDFGQTLAVWGVPAGPYLMVPFAGPRTLRDLTGNGIDFVGSPNSWVTGSLGWSWTASVAGARVLTARDSVQEAIDEGRRQIDPYTTLRRIYLSSRLSRIRNGKTAAATGPSGTALESTYDEYEEYDEYDEYEEYDEYDEYEDYGDADPGGSDAVAPVPPGANGGRSATETFGGTGDPE